MPNISPRVWGRSGWRFLVAVAQGLPSNAPKEVQERYARFFTTDLCALLPCESCRQHCVGHVAKAPAVPTTSADALTRWLYTTVFAPQHPTVTYEQFVDDALSPPPSSWMLVGAAVLVLLVAGAYFVGTRCSTSSGDGRSGAVGAHP